MNPQNQKNSLRTLYETGSNVFDLGDYDTFQTKMKRPESRQKFYSSLSEHYDLGDYKTFEGKILGLLPSDSPQQQYDDTWAGTGKRMFQGLASGAAAIPRGLNIGLAALGKPIAEVSEALGMEGEVARNEKAYKYWAEKGKEVDKYLQGKLKNRFGEVLPSSPEEQGFEGLKPLADPLGTANRLAKIFVENAPTTAMLGIATAVNPAFGTALLFGVEAGDTEQSLDELEASGVKVPLSYRMAAGVTIGALNAALERVGFDAIFKATKVPGLKAKLLQALIASSSEGATEALQEINQVLAESGAKMTEEDLSSMRKVFERTSQDIFENRKRIEQAGLGGAVVGGGISTLASSGVRAKKPVESKPQEPTPQAKPEQPAPQEPAIPKDLQDQLEKVAQEIHGKKFGELTEDQQLVISDELIKTRKASEEKRFKEAIKKAVEPTEKKPPAKDEQQRLDVISQDVYGKPFSEITEEQQAIITDELDKARKTEQNKKLKEAIRKAVSPEPPVEETKPTPQQEELFPAEIDKEAIKRAVNEDDDDDGGGGGTPRKRSASETPAPEAKAVPEEKPATAKKVVSKYTTESIQKMASPSDVDNATLQRVTELEDAGLPLEGDETLDLLDNRSKELYASQKPIAGQQKEAPVKVEPEKPQPVLETKKDATATQIPIASINKDVDRFQNRATDFSEKTAATIAERYDPNLFDPIVIWKDTKDGKTYVLSGHSRLEGMRRRGEKNIPARYFQGTEQDAIRFARLEANRLGTAENLPETLKAFRQAKADKLSKSKLKDLFDGDVDFLESAINLSEKGDFINILGQPANSEFPYIKRFARWVGELRKTYPDKLTDRHEQQIFDWLYKSKKRNVDIGKEAFFDKIEKQITRIDFSSEQPLALTRSEIVSTGTRGRADTKNLEAELDKLKQDKKKARTAAEVQAIDKDISRIQKNISEIVKSQPDLFSDKEQTEDAPKSEPKTVAPPTAKDFSNAVSIFEKAIAGKNTIKEQQASAIAALEKANVNQVIIDELTEPRRSPRPFSEEGDFRELTTRKGRIERAVEPPANVKSKVDAVAESVVDFRNKESDFEQAKSEIIDEIKARGGEVTVDTESGAFTIKLQPGKTKMGLQDALALQKLRREAAEAGAYSLATVGRGFEIAVAPETIKKGESLQGTFADKVKEFVRRHQAYKAAGKSFDKSKADAHDDLVNSYLAERTAGREPQAFKGMSKAGVAVEVLTRRNRSAVEPDVAAKGRDFPREVEALKKKAKERGQKGEPYLETRKASVAKTEQAKERGTYVAEQGTTYTPGSPKSDDFAPIFYSQLERVLDTKLPGSGTPESFLQVVEAFQKKGEFKQEEINWIGLKEWLAEQKGKLTKQQVLDFVRENQVEIKEVEKGKAGSTKFSQYVIPGGENYRELLLTLPTLGLSVDERPTVTGGRWFYVVDKNGKDVYSTGSKDDAERYAGIGGEKFKSTHFDEPNILAHVRFNERTDADGKRVLFLEEIQSDWHQKGRAEGYGTQKTKLPENYVIFENDNAIRDDGKDKWKVIRHHNGLPLTVGEGRTKEEAIADALKAENELRGSVPDAPFKSSWHELAFKRMLRYAADNGFDRMAWTTGEQQADRYDLSKQVDTVFWTPESRHLFVEGKGGEIVFDEQDVSDNRVADVVGKELAERLLTSEPNDNGDVELSGLDLKVGGEGMKGFYDKIIVDFANKYGKKWGAKTQETSIVTDIPQNLNNASAWLEDHGYDVDADTQELIIAGAPEWVINAVESGDIEPAPNVDKISNRATVHAIDITPAMRDAVRKSGQVLFEKQEPYNAKYPKRKDASLKTNILASQAVNAIGHNRRRGRVLLANAINAEAREKGAVSLVGKEVRTSDDVAVLAQVYRDPRWETLRYIFVKNGKVVHVAGVSSRLPSATANFPFADKQEGRAWLRSLMQSTGADGYYMTHNHPSGDITPSDADIKTTASMFKNVSGFKGHVIIDSNKYTILNVEKSHVKPFGVFLKTSKFGDYPLTSFDTHDAAKAFIDRKVESPEQYEIRSTGDISFSVTSTKIDKFFAEERLLVPSRPAPILGLPIFDNLQVASIGKRYQNEKGWAVLISQSIGVRGLMEIEESQLENRKRAFPILRRFARQTGGHSIFAYVSDDFFHRNNARITKAITDGFVTDVISESGFSAIDQFNAKRKAEFGMRLDEFVGREVREPSSSIVKEEVTPYNKNMALMSYEEFENSIKSAKPIATQSQQTQIDFGSRRGQGKRAGGMIRGGMSDVSLQGKQTYMRQIIPNGNTDGLVLNKTKQDDFDSLENIAKGMYLKALSAGLPHELAIPYAEDFANGEDTRYIHDAFVSRSLLSQVSPKDSQIAQEDEAARKIEKCR